MKKISEKEGKLFSKVESVHHRETVKVSHMVDHKVHHAAEQKYPSPDELAKFFIYTDRVKYTGIHIS